MIRALAFSVLATGAPHAPVAPIVVHLSPTQTCPAESMQWDANGLTIIGLTCTGELIFRNGFETAVIKPSSRRLLWPQSALRGHGDLACNVVANDNRATAQAVASEPRVDGTRMDGKATIFFMRRLGNLVAQFKRYIQSATHADRDAEGKL